MKRRITPACPIDPVPETPPAGVDPTRLLSYRRARFQTRLPIDRLYSGDHFWISPLGGGICRVGFTRFAARALGELVEHAWEVDPRAAVRPGQILGWVEGLKAATDIHSAATGTFVGGNGALPGDIGLIAADPYGRGWLYEVQGSPAPDLLDVHAYVRQLDQAIDRALGVPPASSPRS
jgi:glycine cleavage system H protein